MRTIAALAAVGSAAAFQAPVAPLRQGSRTAPVMQAPQSLKDLAAEQNPVIGYFDPMGLGGANLWPYWDGMSQEATVGFLRQAEIKHGRVAMAGFVGFIVHSNGITWPFPMTLAGDPFPQGLSPGDAWDAIPELSKWQIILVIGFLEAWSENSDALAAEGQKHYMKGGKPGYFPTFDQVPHPALNLFDPFGNSANVPADKKAKQLNMEVNNGRLAMIGLFGFLMESKTEGSVPFLKGLVAPYSGDYMAPFGSDFHILDYCGNFLCPAL